MKFKNYKNKLERPFIVYADTECTLVKTNDPNKIHEHVVNSCCLTLYVLMTVLKIDYGVQQILIVLFR